MHQYYRFFVFLFFIPVVLASPPAFTTNTAKSANADNISFITTDLTIVNEDGGHHVFKGDYAYTKQQLAHGLMFRRHIADDYAMLFDFTHPRPASFWMKNTYIPLDILFVRADGRINNIIKNATPHSLLPMRSNGPVRAVIEVKAGTVDRLNITEKSYILHRIFPTPSP